MDNAPAPSSIGRLRESDLHEQLKYRYAGATGSVEAEVDGFVVDVLNENEIVEIQTRGFGKLRRKIERLGSRYRLRIVHPIALETQITKLNPDGELLSSRRSPRRGRLEEVYRELVSIADLLPHDNVSIEVALVRAIEIRVDDGKGSWRRHGVSIVSRRLAEVEETITLATADDYARAVPDDLPGPFSNSDLMARLGLRYRQIQPMTSALRKMGIIQVAERKGRELLYSRTASSRAAD